MTVLYWSRLSDRYGRKPVILTGLFGLSLSMYSFGLSRTYWGAVFSRSLNGALNGNIGVIKCMVAEITDHTNIAHAYAYLPISWATGQALGPAIGGYFSRPAEQFPDVFGNNEFMKKYPYFLACSIPATFSVLAWLVTLMFLKETNATSVAVSDLWKKSKSTEDLPRTASSSSVSSITTKASTPEPMPMRAILTKPVIIAAVNYAFLALVDMTLRAVQPVFLSTPIELGGLGLPPYKIGRVLSFYGVFNGLFQIFLFARINERFGTKKVYVVGIASSLIVFAFFPVINLLARAGNGPNPIVWAAVGFQVIMSIIINFSYGCVFIYIAASAPNKSTLGAVNGLAQVGVSIMRTVGPATANSLFSFSIERGYLGGYFVYVVLAAIVVISLVVADQLPNKVWRDEKESESSS
ncbi:hypothetical protein NLI96_g448 [Meripilus lineatus]|uniref:Major facilitator superfamily (MFS) profile domain-containing protein n=1 Tax=Meripilus lineatus TaxID=2056292 RepID=A0AAD5YNY5_9APHY|nr:hypothetical protein NLI96_g448 [Physisporinus lineatus]